MSVAFNLLAADKIPINDENTLQIKYLEWIYHRMQNFIATLDIFTSFYQQYEVRVVRYYQLGKIENIW